ncbi:MAG: hypothetical protein R3C05_24920 [Pirellulaceae bacterium]
MQQEGETCPWQDVRDELQTQSLFAMGQSRVVIVREADKFVLVAKPELEAYVGKPSSVAKLIIEVKSFPSNTKLYKAVSKQHSVVQCSIPSGSGRSTKPDMGRLKTFLCEYVAPRHSCKLQVVAADTLIELAGTSVGLLDTDIAKLAFIIVFGGRCRRWFANTSGAGKARRHGRLSMRQPKGMRGKR